MTTHFHEKPRGRRLHCFNLDIRDIRITSLAINILTLASLHDKTELKTLWMMQKEQERAVRSGDEIALKTPEMREYVQKKSAINKKLEMFLVDSKYESETSIALLQNFLLSFCEPLKYITNTNVDCSFMKGDCSFLKFELQEESTQYIFQYPPTELNLLRVLMRRLFMQACLRSILNEVQPSIDYMKIMNMPFPEKVSRSPTGKSAINSSLFPYLFENSQMLVMNYMNIYQSQRLLALFQSTIHILNFIDGRYLDDHLPIPSHEDLADPINLLRGMIQMVQSHVLGHHWELFQLSQILDEMLIESQALDDFAFSKSVRRND